MFSLYIPFINVRSHRFHRGSRASASCAGRSCVGAVRCRRRAEPIVYSQPSDEAVWRPVLGFHQQAGPSGCQSLPGPVADEVICAWRLPMD